MKVTVETRFGGNIIEQIDRIERGPGPTEELARRLINLQDEGVRKALIAMGWTPPQE